MELSFEYTIRTFLGEKALNIAGLVHDEKYRKRYFRESLKKIFNQIEKIDTTSSHKERMFSATQSLLDELKSNKTSDIKVSIKLLRLVGALLGYSGVMGAIVNTPFYYQDPGQHYTEMVFKGEDPLSDYTERKNAITKRKKIIEQLKSEGMTDFEISLVLNTTEYQIKKLRKSLYRDRSGHR